MKTVLAIITIFGTIAASAARAQVEPQATSPGKVTVSGTLTYSARYSQIAEFYSNRSGLMANLSGDFGYTSASERHPTALTISAGDSWSLTGIGFSSGPYENFSVSQSINGRRLVLLLRDEVGYRHGVGVGEPNPTSANSGAEPVLTLNTAVLDNDAKATLSDKISGSTTVTAGAGYNQLEYFDGAGRNTTSLMMSGEMNHRFEGRNEFFGEDVFVQYGYPNSAVNLKIDSNSTVAGWSRTWSRRVTTSVSAGPQWVTFQSSTPLPSYTGYSVSASVSDALKFGTATASFSHGVVGGGGYFYGSQVEDLSGSFGRRFGHHVGSEVSIAVVGGYRRTDSLSAVSSISQLNGGLQGSLDAKYGFVEATRQLGRHFSAYAGYTATDQSQSSTTPTSSGLLNSVWQTVSFGLGFTPPPIHLRQ